MSLGILDTPLRNPPKVSVCVITYNQEQYIGDCLESLVTQKTDFQFEILVADDASTDRTREIVNQYIARYPNLIKACFQSRNTGGSQNNLMVHRMAQGEYVAHIDGDDYALPGKLQLQSDILDGDKSCVAVWHNVDYFDDCGRFISGESRNDSLFPNNLIEFKDAIRLGFIGVFSSLMYRRSAREIIDPSRQILDLYFTWDLLSKGNGHIITTVLGRYRVSSSGSIQSTSSHKVILLGLEHAEEFASRFPLFRKDFFIWAVTKAVVYGVKRQAISTDYLRFAWRYRHWINPLDIVRNYSRMRQNRVRWR
jgi:glycosyltransferase involved in cell wall biosynthesis